MEHLIHYQPAKDIFVLFVFECSALHLMPRSNHGFRMVSTRKRRSSLFSENRKQKAFQIKMRALSHGKRGYGSSFLCWIPYCPTCFAFVFQTSASVHNVLRTSIMFGKPESRRLTNCTGMFIPRGLLRCTVCCQSVRFLLIWAVTGFACQDDLFVSPFFRSLANLFECGLCSRSQQKNNFNRSERDTVTRIVQHRFGLSERLE